MKLQELIALETEIINGLRERAQKGDNEAAKVLLSHLLQVSKNIDEWKATKDERKLPR